jgi:hypothetical protein
MIARLIFYNGKSPNNRRSKKESKDVGIENFDGRIIITTATLYHTEPLGDRHPRE